MCASKQGAVASGHANTVGYSFNFKASNSNTIYGKSTTVTPLSLTTKYYIRY